MTARGALRWLAVASLLAGACDDGGDGATAPPAACDRYPSQSGSPFVLPYRVGSAFRVIQANCSAAPRTHQTGGPFQFAYDFDMPIGTAVVAARAGVVLATEQRFEDGNRTPGQENFVFVRHADGTIARYYHLTRNGVLVQVGASVQQGDAIGLSGDTGLSALPHLHFDVTRCPAVGCPTYPVVFRNTAPHPTGLVAGETYGALP